MKESVFSGKSLLRFIRGTGKKTAVGGKQVHLQIRALLDRYPVKINLQSGLIIWICVVGAHLCSSLIAPLFFKRHIQNLHSASSRIPQLRGSVSSEIKPYEFYQAAAAGRQIFGRLRAQEIREGNPAVPAVPTAELISSLALLGIISGDYPQAIIEDKRVQKTYYISKGQSIGELQVADIQEGKIILKRNGERFELHM